jgi:hypothetical protein
VINFEEVIRHVWDDALHLQLSESDSDDQEALRVLEDKAAPNRAEVIRRWLKSYQVFQGIDGPSRLAIATGIVQWADSRDLRMGLAGVDDIVAAHDALKQVCINAYGEQRDFTSLASKALWLCYPASVPIFDSFVQRTLWVISKLEPDIALPHGDVDEYRKFVHVWKGLYDGSGEIET